MSYHALEMRKDKYIDARTLTFNLHFQYASLDQVIQLAYLVQRYFIITFTEDFILDLMVGKKAPKPQEAASTFEVDISTSKRGNLNYSAMGYDGSVKCDKVKTKKQLRSIRDSWQVGGRSSLDYSDTIKKYYADISNSAEALKEAISSIINLEDKYDIESPDWHDSMLSYSGHKSDEGDYVGNLHFVLAGYTINYTYHEHTKWLISFLKEAQKIIKIANAHISLSVRSLSLQTGIPHHCYFYSNDAPLYNPEQDTEDLRDRYPYDYLLGTEWGNYLPSALVSRIPNFIGKCKQTKVLDVEMLQNGDCLLTMTKPMEKITVSDKFILKSILAPILIPGYSILPVHFIRPYWEQVAISPDDIRIVEWKPEQYIRNPYQPISQRQVLVGFGDYAFTNVNNEYIIIL